MSLRIVCAKCRKSIQAPESALGKKVRCPGCNAVVLVEAAAKSKPTPPEPPKKIGKKTTLAIDPPKPGRKTMLVRDDDDDEDERPLKPAKRSPREDDDERPQRKKPARDEGIVDRKKSAPVRNRRDEDDDRSVRRPRSKKKAAGSPVLLISLLAVGGLFLLGAAAGVFFLWPSGAAKKDEVRIAQQQPEKKNEEIAPKNDGAKKIDGPAPVDIPGGPLPTAIAAENTRKVKQATAFLKVTGKNGVSEGSGFFAVEPGVIFTNAHVLGMLRGKDRPSKVEVVLHSGETNEVRTTGEILGVDQDSDLAVVRVPAETKNMPTPLAVDFFADLTELQKVYIFGFPLGSQLGKNITVAESSISSIRKEAGVIEQIQVNGGMHPGNSGGPVVDTRGNVIAVAVAGIRGTQINFAIPGEKVQGLLNGRIRDSQWGEPFRDAAQTKLPVTLTCIDPLNRIKEVKLDLWTGSSGSPRPASLKAPASQTGDAAKSTLPLSYAQGKVNQDVVLPPLPGGHVYWLQPCMVSPTGQMQWAVATPLQPGHSIPLDRLPVNLTHNPESTPERSLKLAGKFEVRISKGSKESAVASQHMNFDVLELVNKGPRGTEIRLALGQGDFVAESSGKKIPRSTFAQNLVRNMIYTFTANPTGRIFGFGTPVFNQKIPFETRLMADDLAEFFTNSYQAVSLSVPNRDVKPLETWPATVPLMLDTGKKKDFADLNLQCTYEGCRTVNGQTEATIRMVGELKRRGPQFPGSMRPREHVTGRAVFDSSKGYFTKVNIAVRADIDDDGVFLARVFEFGLQRDAGNVYKIARPADRPTTPNPPVAGGKVILQQVGNLNPADPPNPHRAGTRQKSFTVNLQASKTYVIELTALPGSMLDTYLRVDDFPGSRILAEDDDSGGDLNSRIVFRPQKSGPHRLVATSFKPQFGAFEIKVTEATPGATALPATGEPLARRASERKPDENAASASAMFSSGLRLDARPVSRP